jgi:hypothetical protein
LGVKRAKTRGKWAHYGISGEKEGMNGLYRLGCGQDVQNIARKRKTGYSLFGEILEKKNILGVAPLGDMVY